MKFVYILILLVITQMLHAQQLITKQYKEDLDYFLNTIEANYAYWDKKQTDWQKVKQIFTPAADTITTRSGFIDVLEKIFYELYDHHASLNTNTQSSQRLVPSGTDIWAGYVNGKPTILQLRSGTQAMQKGLKPGMEIVQFNGVDVQSAIKDFLGRSIKQPDPEAMNYALRTLLAGKHNGDRVLKVRYNNNESVIDAGSPRIIPHKELLSSHVLVDNIGYIRFTDHLYDNNTIPAFDSALQKLKNTEALIIDMRNTASGGNTTVARAILGSFISKEGFYQRHEIPAEEKEMGVRRSWAEIVSPRTYVYTKPLVILVNHWTGSIGEGITIGFDGLKRATIVGTEMAGLNGANYSFNLPNSGIGFSFPAEKLFHVDGTPRELFKPHVIVKEKGIVYSGGGVEDEIMLEGIKIVNSKVEWGPRR
jgi:C-terminal processing protease CtpA/Prc